MLIWKNKIGAENIKLFFKNRGLKKRIHLTKRVYRDKVQLHQSHLLVINNNNNIIAYSDFEDYYPI